MPARSIAARAATTPRSTALCVANAPLSLANGVRAPPRITARRDGSDIISRLLVSGRGPRALGNAIDHVRDYQPTPSVSPDDATPNHGLAAFPSIRPLCG